MANNKGNGKVEMSSSDTGKNDTKKGNFQVYLIIGIVAFLIGVGVGKIGKTDNTEVSLGDTNVATSSLNKNIALQNISDLLEVDNQSAGLEVVVKKIKVSESVWVAIHEDNGQGEPGNILGAQLFDPIMTSGTVELLRNTEVGKTYYAVIRGDNGDRAFIPKMDMPILDSNGRPLMVTFKTDNEMKIGTTSPEI